MSRFDTGVQRNKKKSKFFIEFIRQWELQVMVIPAIILVVVFSYIPMFGIVIAFQNYKIGDFFGFSQFVGLKNFKDFIKDPNLLLIIRNTLCISVLKLIFTFPAPIILALLFNEMNSVAYKRIIQTTSYLPHFLSYVVVAALFTDLLSVRGSINELLMNFSLIPGPINFFSKPSMFWPILVVSDLWKELGWGSILYLGAMSAVNVESYEAAVLDGAGRWQKIWHITLPYIKPTIVIMLVFSISGLLSANFEQIMLFTNQLRNTLVIDVADVIDTYVYRLGINGGRYSYSAAVGLFRNVISFLLLLAANWVAKKTTEESLF